MMPTCIKILSSAILGFSIFWQLNAQVSNIKELEGPIFTQEPKSLIAFSNTTGAKIDCTARGNPQPSITWRHSYGSPIANVSRLRQVFPNGTLFFPPFKAEDYRQDVHSAVYVCVATNSIGTIISREVAILAVIMQHFDMYVYDQFTIRGNTAIFRCLVRPRFLKEYVQVISWIRDDDFTIQANDIEKDDKYSILPSGELLLHQAGPEDSHTSFRCKAKHTLTGEIKISTAGRLIIYDSDRNIAPLIWLHQTSVRVEEGQTAIIPCVSTGHPLPDIKWFTNTSGQMKPVTHHNRYRLIQGTILIDNVQQIDGGKYICESDNAAGLHRIETELVVYGRLSVTVSPVTADVELGHNVTFNCEVSGYPVKYIQWYRNGEQLLSTKTKLKRNNASLRVRSVMMYDIGMYQCFVKSDFEVVQAGARLKFGVPPVPPKIVPFSFLDYTIVEGDLVQVSCVLYRGHLPLDLRWFKDDVLITSDFKDMRIRVFDEYSSILSIDNVSLHHAGKYTCSANNEIAETNYTATLTVNAPPHWVVTPQDTSALVGSSVTIDCNAEGFPKPTIQWMTARGNLSNNQRDLVTSNGHMQILSNGSLRIPCFTEVYEGYYFCVASNGIGDRLTKAMYLKIRRTVSPLTILWLSLDWIEASMT